MTVDIKTLRNEFSQIDMTPFMVTKVAGKKELKYIPWQAVIFVAQRLGHDVSYGLIGQDYVNADGITEHSLYLRDTYSKTGTVYVWVEVDDIRREGMLPILDDDNRPVIDPTTFQIDNAKQRCMVKIMAIDFMLGHQAYGDDTIISGLGIEYKPFTDLVGKPNKSKETSKVQEVVQEKKEEKVEEPKPKTKRGRPRKQAEAKLTEPSKLVELDTRPLSEVPPKIPEVFQDEPEIPQVEPAPQEVAPVQEPTPQEPEFVTEEKIKRLEDGTIQITIDDIKNRDVTDANGSVRFIRSGICPTCGKVMHQHTLGNVTRWVHAERYASGETKVCFGLGIGVDIPDNQPIVYVENIAPETNNDIPF